MIDKMVRTTQLANKLLKYYGLAASGWRFDFHSKKRSVGTCNHTDKAIYMSLHYVKHTPMKSIEDTIRHEIAHALVGPNHGHDYEWKVMALRVGATPKSCAEEGTVVSTAKHNYVVKCDNPDCPDPAYMRRFRLRRELVYRYHCKACKGRLTAYEIARG